MRELICDPSVGEITQGAIFNCLRTPDGGRAFGLVISARCDLAQKKSKTVLCLPIIPLSIWIERVAKKEAVKKGGKAVDLSLRDILKKYKIAQDSFKIYGYDTTIKVLKEKKITKDDLIKIEILKLYIEKNEIVNSNKQMRESYNKILEALWNNTRMDSHFIERICVNENPEGYVVDFTQPTTLYRTVVDELSLGLEKFRYERDVDGKYFSLDLSDLDQGEVISKIQAPFIELIMQRFTHFYSRIGTEDIADPDIKYLKETYEIS